MFCHEGPRQAYTQRDRKPKGGFVVHAKILLPSFRAPSLFIACSKWFKPTAVRHSSVSSGGLEVKMLLQFSIPLRNSGIGDILDPRKKIHLP
ncbi:hypothetical protein CEXT_200551 [Caerostris extrusa]|uniref:Uncharacterized protein n=1 Tax=Caerostris extrusa TaxID=172846 RepID=A0AAV4MWI9_CAEEX|nr:hypothetical protein CEXT_200551 [Caerostris extrusa]